MTATPFTVIIPARFGSTRLPGKALRSIAGKTMIERVYGQAARARASRIIVATDDERIVAEVESFGGEALLTDSRHQSGTDRLAEVARRCAFSDDEIVVNVQGDEPLIPPPVIDQVAENLAANSGAAVATLAEVIGTSELFLNPNVVKVVTDDAGRALYFSRAPIPWPRDLALAGEGALPDGFSPRRHVGIYAYRVRELKDFVTWPQAPLETVESLEQLRFLWHGCSIHVDDARYPVPGGVDTADDLARVTAIIEAGGHTG